MRKTAYVGRVVMSPAPHHALRHAGRATAIVGVTYGADTVELWIYDVGAGTMDGLRAEDLASALARMTHQFTCVYSPRSGIAEVRYAPHPCVRRASDGHGGSERVQPSASRGR